MVIELWVQTQSLMLAALRQLAPSTVLIIGPLINDRTATAVAEPKEKSLQNMI